MQTVRRLLAGTTILLMTVQVAGMSVSAAVRAGQRGAVGATCCCCKNGERCECQMCAKSRHSSSRCTCGLQGRDSQPQPAPDILAAVPDQSIEFLDPAIGRADLPVAPSIQDSTVSPPSPPPWS